MWKKLLFLSVIAALGIIGFVAIKSMQAVNQIGNSTNKESPFSFLSQDKIEKKATDSQKENPYPLGKPINIMLLGIDRRARDEAFRTDIMILLSINPDTNKVTMVSLPRDLWYDGDRLNAKYLTGGWESLKTAVTNISGLTVDKFILTDFKDFSWIVDAMGGVPVSVDTTFTDTEFPVDETKEYQTIAFTAGPEKLTGERALIYARSRHGDNAEGSDWMRMKRQHKILKGMLEAVLQPQSLFNPMVVENAFTTVTTGKMDTNLQISDAKYLWDFYKDKDKYEIISLYLDDEYLYNPPMEEYGGAWVMVAKNGSYAEFQNVLHNKLYAIPDEPAVDTSSDTTELVPGNTDNTAN